MNDLKFLQAKKFFAAALLGAFAISFPVTADARIHDPKVETKSVERKLPTLRERVAETMSKFKVSPEEKIFNAFEEPQNFSVPATVSTADTSIIGTPIATQQQCVKYLLRNNPHPNLKVSAEEIVAYYYEEGASATAAMSFPNKIIIADSARRAAASKVNFSRRLNSVSVHIFNICLLILRHDARLCLSSIRATVWFGKLTARGLSVNGKT